MASAVPSETPKPGVRWRLQNSSPFSHARMKTSRTHHVVIAIDGPGASGKSTTARKVADALGFVLVDTGAMYRTLAWYCLQHGIDAHDDKAVAGACRRWPAALKCIARRVFLTVEGFHPEKEVRSPEVSAAVPHVAAVPKVRDWMKKAQRRCVDFGDLVMEGRDIGSNVFPETDFKYYLDADPKARQNRRAAEGVQEDVGKRDLRDSSRAAAPLMVPLGAKVVDNSKLTLEQTVETILRDFRSRSKAT